MPEIVISLRMTYKQVALQSLSQNPKLYRDSLLRPQLSCSEPKQTRAAPDVCDGRALQRGTCPLISSRPISLLIYSYDLWAVDALFGVPVSVCTAVYSCHASLRNALFKSLTMTLCVIEHSVPASVAFCCVFYVVSFQFLGTLLQLQDCNLLLLKTNCLSHLDEFSFNENIQ